jgi:hypothetical protein
MLEEDRAEQPGNRELDLVDMAFAYRVQLDAVERELLAQPCDILGITREPVERLAHDNVNLARLDRAQQSPQAGPVAAIARKFRIEPRRRAAEIADQRCAGSDLVGARRCGLHGGRVPAI